MSFKNYNSYNEAFDKPYKWKLDLTLNDYKDFTFTTDDDTLYLVVFVFRGQEDKEFTSVSFETENGDMGVTGDGDAFRVFATVLDILKSEGEMLIARGPLKFTSAMDEPSRVKLYDTMVKRLGKKMGYKHFKKKIVKGHSIYSHAHYTLHNG